MTHFIQTRTLLCKDYGLPKEFVDACLDSVPAYITQVITLADGGQAPAHTLQITTASDLAAVLAEFKESVTRRICDIEHARRQSVVFCDGFCVDAVCIVQVYPQAQLSSAELDLVRQTCQDIEDFLRLHDFVRPLQVFALRNAMIVSCLTYVDIRKNTKLAEPAKPFSYSDEEDTVCEAESGGFF